MFCTACGLQIKDEDPFCSGCGRPTGVPPTTPAAVRPRLSRPMYDKKIAGVCAGFARYFGIDVTLVRVLWLVIGVFTGVGLLAYPIAWICMPKDETPICTVPVQQM